MIVCKGPSWSWSWSYGSWIYNYLCNQCLSPLTLRVRISLSQGVLDTTLRDKVYQWLAARRWVSPSTLVYSTIKADHWNIVESGIKHHNLNLLLIVCKWIFILIYLQKMNIKYYVKIQYHYKTGYCWKVFNFGRSFINKCKVDFLLKLFW
jgi:hypothetical protein